MCLYTIKWNCEQRVKENIFTVDEFQHNIKLESKPVYVSLTWRNRRDLQT